MEHRCRLSASGPTTSH